MTLQAEEVRTRLRGVSIGLLTPFDEDLAVTHDGITANARDLYEAGARTFLAAANISEYHALSEDERVEVVKTAVDALPSDACVLAGVGGHTAEARELATAHERVGADGLMIMSPDHTYLHERGILHYYEKIAEACEVPLVPYIRGIDPSVEFLAEVARVDRVIGIKYALPDAVKLGEAIARSPENVVWVNGLAEPYAVPFWNEGIEGFTAGVSNFRPAVGLELFEALSDADWERARALRNACMPFQRFRDESGTGNDLSGAISVPAVKKGLELAGLRAGEGRVREPLVPLSTADEARAEELYQQLDDDIERLIG